MPTVTLDTILAERADVAMLIDTALRQGWDVAVLAVYQSHLAPDWVYYKGKPANESAGSRRSLSVFAKLPRVTGINGNALMVKPSRWDVGITFPWYSLGITDDRPIPRLHATGYPEIVWLGDNAERVLHISSPWVLRKQSLSASLTPTPAQERQVREAVSVLAHACMQRDIFVSDNIHAFVRLGRRQALERLLKTRIMTADEFFSWLAKHRRKGNPRRP